ncbi:MAG: PTS system fructose subfamily transporter subunit IIA [Lachnospiraceae bacterium]|nr:PTS system fructose subfamily transporter subunit IIA [Lachnospiraceae bacterium]
MRKYLFASHAYMAEGTKSSLELILGKQESVDILCAYVKEPYDIKEEIHRKLSELDPEDEMIVVTDLFGGSVNNEFMTVAAENENVYLVSGMNLALCMNLVVRKDDDCTTDALIRDCMEETRDTLIYCNDLLKNTQDKEDEEF